MRPPNRWRKVAGLAATAVLLLGILQIYMQAQNLTNQATYLGYSGTLTSPFFGKPKTVGGMRKSDGGIGLNF